MPALIRWNPNGGPLRPFFRPAHLLDEFEAVARNAFNGALKPSLDVYEEGKNIIVKAELPGIARGDVDIQLDDDVLTITAEKKDEREEGEEGTTHYHRERTFGTYVRTVTLPARVDAESVKATLKKGSVSF